MRACGYWFQDGVPWLASVSRGAVAGNAAHDGFQADHDGDVIDLDEASRAKVVAVRPVLDQLRARGTGSWAEMALAYDPETDTARVLGTGREAYATAKPGEMCGTADLVVRLGPQKFGVWDFKNHVPGRDVDAADQLRTLALLISRAFGVDEIEIGTILTNESCAYVGETDTLSFFDLEDEQNSLNEDMHPIDTSPRPGSHCHERYCPARATCPVAEGAVDALAPTVPVSALTQRHRLELDIRSDAHLEWTLAALKLVEERAAAIKAAAYSYVDERGTVTFEDGREFSNRMQTTERPALDVPGAVDAIRAAGGADAIKSSTTWSALESVLGAKRAEDLRDGLREMGAVKTGQKPDYRARQTEAQKAAKKRGKKGKAA